MVIKCKKVILNALKILNREKICHASCFTVLIYFSSS